MIEFLLNLGWIAPTAAALLALRASFKAANRKDNGVF